MRTVFAMHRGDTSPPPTIAPYVTQTGAAALLGVTRGTVANMLRRGDLHAMTIGRRRVIAVAEVRRYIRANAGKAS